MDKNDVTPEAIAALAHLRFAVRTGLGLEGHVRDAVNILDDAGVFAALDEAVDYASAEEILTESALQTCPECAVYDGHHIGCSRIDWDEYKASADPAPARHQGVTLGVGQKLTQELAEAMFEVANPNRSPFPEGPPLERIPGTDIIRPAHEHVFRSPHSDEVCYGAEWCTRTYGEHRKQN
jgi:hypothetical protein